MSFLNATRRENLDRAERILEELDFIVRNLDSEIHDTWMGVNYNEDGESVYLQALSDCHAVNRVTNRLDDLRRVFNGISQGD